MSKCRQIISLLFLVASLGCKTDYLSGTFGYDVKLLMENTETVVLQSGNSLIAVTSDYQGRVMTSSSNGYKGASYGWINHDLIKGSNGIPQKGAIGGEDRLWFGPEYGKFSLFFKPGVPMIAKNVTAPKPITVEPFELVRQTKKDAIFSSSFSLTNYQGNKFNIHAKREISILSREEIEEELKISIPSDISYVGFQSTTSMKNKGPDWSKETGLVSIWVIGAFPPSQTATAVIPVTEYPDTITSYWSSVGPDRLTINGNTVFYKCDGAYLHKIGVQPKHTTPVFGSYNPGNGVLTVVRFSFTGESDYVNSRWIEQKDPYAGDVINIFNDGETEAGGPFGPFYELESSSPAKALKKGESLIHKHATFHFVGNEKTLDRISNKTLGVSLIDIVNAFES